MRKIIYWASAIALVGLLACKSTQNKHIEDASTTETTKGIWRFEAKRKFKQNDMVAIELYHEQDTTLRLMRPMEMKLEFEENGAWRLVKQLYCICLENCPPPPREREIAAKERFTFQWKAEERWCEPSLKTLPAPVGKYRLIINHMKGMERKLYVQHYEFQIIK